MNAIYLPRGLLQFISFVNVLFFIIQPTSYIIQVSKQVPTIKKSFIPLHWCIRQGFMIYSCQKPPAKKGKFKMGLRRLDAFYFLKARVCSAAAANFVKYLFIFTKNTKEYFALVLYNMYSLNGSQGRGQF